jgi:hypothetical protein
MNLSWNDRLALLNHFKPSEEVACKVFDVTPGELKTARQLEAAKTFQATKNIDTAKYANLFSEGNVMTTTQTQQPTATSFTKPETATKRVVAAPKKRGRKGDKIQHALLAVPSKPMPVSDFITKHGVSLAVLRQAKRFVAAYGDDFAKKVGTVNVRQDKTTKELMIWKS